MLVTGSVAVVPGPPTTARVRLWTGGSVALAGGGAGGGAVASVGVRCPNPLESGLVNAALEELAALHVASPSAARKAHTQHTTVAASPIDVCVDPYADRPISDMIVALRDAGWLSPALSSTYVVVVPIAVAPLHSRMPGIAHADVLVRGSKVDVYGVFCTTPWSLYRTVLQDEILPCVPAADGGNAFSSVSPIKVATFVLGELDRGQGGFLSAALTGLSVARGHEGARHPPPLQQPLLPPSLPVSAAALLAEALDRSPARPMVVSCDLGALPCGAAPLGVLEAIRDDYLVPSNGPRKTQALFCYELPAGTDLAAIGFCAIYDCNSEERVGHVSLQRLANIEVVPWVTDEFLMMSRLPGAIPVAAVTAEVCMVGAGKWAAPLLAALFKLHCFMIRGRAGFKCIVDPNQPGADVDVADALEVCTSCVPEDERLMQWLLEACLAARYSLDRMDNEVRGELAAAFDRAASSEELAPEDARALARGSERLSAWTGGDGTGIIMQYASGPEPRDAARPPASGAVVPIADLLSQLRVFHCVPPAEIVELPSVAASSALCAGPPPRNILAAVGAAAGQQPCSPMRLHHVCDALNAPHASAWASRAHSTELVLRGIPLAEMAGVMAELEDPEAQRVLLACAMLALGEPATGDAPVFVFAAPTPPPLLDAADPQGGRPIAVAAVPRWPRLRG